MKLRDMIKVEQDRRVIVAAYADSPSPTDEKHDLTSMPHSWASNAVDRLKNNNVTFNDFVENSDPKVIDATWDEVGGPVVLIEMAIRELLDYANPVGIAFRITSFCASIEYETPKTAVLLQNRPMAVCERQVVTGFSVLDGACGCNPSGCIVLPCANRFTSEVSSARRFKFKSYYDDRRFFDNRPKLLTSYLRTLFPDIDFSVNRILDKFARKAKPGKGEKRYYSNNWYFDATP